MGAPHQVMLVSGATAAVLSQWNPADKSPTITLTNGNATANATVNGQSGVRGLSAKTTGKLYFEIAFGSLLGAGSSDTYTGVCDSNTSLTAQPIFTTTGTDHYACYRFNGQYGSDAGFAGGTTAVGGGAHVIGIVADFSTRTMTLYIDGVSTVSIAWSAGATSMFPWYASQANFADNAGTLRVVTAEFTQAIPPGASEWGV